MVKLIICMCTLRQILCIGLIKSEQGNTGEVWDKRYIQNFSRKNLKGWESFEYISVNVRIILV
jgi:hypothetical protein